MLFLGFLITTSSTIMAIFRLPCPDPEARPSIQIPFLGILTVTPTTVREAFKLNWYD